MKQDTALTIKNAQLRFRNFAGKELRYNPEGRRNFCVLLDNEKASKLLADGWNVRYLKGRDESEEDRPYIQVTVSFDYFPPKVYLLTKTKKTLLDESNIAQLDWAEIEYVDLVIRPYHWQVSGKEGVKAYLKSLYVTIVEDELDEKYSYYDEELPFE